MTGPNPFEMAQTQLAECARILRLDPSVHEVLRRPKREVHVALPVRMDDGSLRVFPGHRVVHNDARGPAQGGIRFHPNETPDTSRALAAWSTWKCALLDLPLGGAMGGVSCAPKEMSPGELERLSRAYVDRVWDVLGPERDVPAPDLYTSPQVMAWMMDEYSRLAGRQQAGVITGKPAALGGSAGWTDAAARGGAVVVREAAGLLGLELAGAPVAVQGFGRVGYHMAALARNLLGCRVVAVSDSRSGIYAAGGLDVEDVRVHKIRTGWVADFPGTKAISNEELLELKVDVLMPAAVEAVITDRNAARVKAKIVAEMANGPTTNEADLILERNGVHVIPDFLCNAGGVTVSYFEMVQNVSLDSWDEDEVHRRLDRRMAGAYHSVLGASRQHNLGLRQAAYVLAVERVVEAMRLRGWL